MAWRLRSFNGNMASFLQDQDLVVKVAPGSVSNSDQNAETNGDGGVESGTEINREFV